MHTRYVFDEGLQERTPEKLKNCTSFVSRNRHVPTVFWSEKKCLIRFATGLDGLNAASYDRCCGLMFLIIACCVGLKKTISE